MADAARRAGHRAALHPGGRRLHARPRRPRPAGRRREAGRAHGVRPTCSARCRPCAGIADAAHAAGAARRWSTAPSTRRTCTPTSGELGCDFFGFTSHKLLRPHRHRRALGTRGAAGGHARVPRRRRDDPRRPPRRVDAQRDPPQVRGRHPADRRSRRPRGGHRLPRGVWAWTPCASTRWRSPTTRCARSPSASATASRSTARPTADVRGGTISFSFGDLHPARRLPGARPGGRVRPRRPPLRQAAHAAPRRERHGEGVVVRLQRRTRRRRVGGRSRRDE